ncbi:MAG TPA: DUF1501 domain-containing protein [Planctomycetaceae bacterium]|nr:DUF1501 domain-containing protein [Planctomycetaceae bacterium]
MLSLVSSHRGSSPIPRREWLRVGGLSAVGLSLPTLLAARGATAATSSAVPAFSGELGATFGRAKNVIFLWLQGGPPQHETFDPKPDAPLEIRGPFKPISTNVPGIQFSELLPRTSRYADRLAVVRSLSTRDDNHDVSGYWLLTGYPYLTGSARQIKPSDWPYFGSVVKMLKPSEKLPALTSVWIPDAMRLNDNVTPAGQTAGFLGAVWEPERFVGDPALPEYQIEGLRLPEGVQSVRMDQRREMLRQLEAQLHGRSLSHVAAWDRLSQQAFDLVTSGEARAAFDLSREPDAVRDRYGRYTWGQSVLLARRLIEAGVRLVHVNWARDPGDNAVDNPLWDTHSLNADRLQDNLCPQFDPTFAALMDDLSERGLLDETLVVVIGEFGRTPKINVNGGRDHWGHVFSFAMAGAGIRGGQVIGASDRDGAYPASTPLTGGDLTATIFHLLGIDPGGVFHDRQNRPHPLTKGEPIAGLLGERLTSGLQVSEGDPAFVPPFDTRLLFDTNFHSSQPLLQVEPPSRTKGWRGWSQPGLLVSKTQAGVEFRCGGESASDAIVVNAGSRALLAQEIRNARGGHYSLRVRVTTQAGSADEYQSIVQQLRLRLVLFRFSDMRKDPRTVSELAAVEFRPEFGQAREFLLDRFLGSTSPGANFAIGSGLGVLMAVEAMSTIELSRDQSERFRIVVESVDLQFQPRQRDDSVTV